MINGQEDLWSELCRLRKEVKDVLYMYVYKKLKVWNKVAKKVRFRRE